MKLLGVLLIVLLLSAGCSKSLRTIALSDVSSIPDVAYMAYIFSADDGEKLKVIMLKGPGSNVDVVAYSSEIIVIKGKPREVLALLGENRAVSIEKVTLDDKTVGYLLISDRELLEARSLRVDLLVRSGKIYFSITKTSF